MIAVPWGAVAHRVASVRRWTGGLLTLLLELKLIVFVLLDLALLIVVVLYEVLEIVLSRSYQIFKQEGSSEGLAEVVTSSDVEQEPLEELELPIVSVLLEGRDGDSVAELHTKAVDGVVNEHHIFHGYISDNSKVLNVNIIGRLDAAFSVEAVLKQYSLGVDIV